jgi:hypothetical protein
MAMFDDLIDEAAHELTEGTPHASFKARVLAKLDEQPVVSRSRRWMLVPAAVAAIVVLAVVMPREEPAEIRL